MHLIKCSTSTGTVKLLQGGLGSAIGPSRTVSDLYLADSCSDTGQIAKTSQQLAASRYRTGSFMPFNQRVCAPQETIWHTVDGQTPPTWLSRPGDMVQVVHRALVLSLLGRPAHTAHTVFAVLGPASLAAGIAVHCP